MAEQRWHLTLPLLDKECCRRAARQIKKFYGPTGALLVFNMRPLLEDGNLGPAESVEEEDNHA